MEPEVSLPHSQAPATCLVHAPSKFLNMHFNIILASMPRSSKWSLSFRFPHQNPCTHLSFSRCVLHASAITRFLICSLEWYLVRSAGHEAPHCAVFSSLLLPPLSPIQVSYSAPCSRTAFLPKYERPSFIRVSNWGWMFTNYLSSSDIPLLEILLQLLQIIEHVLIE